MEKLIKNPDILIDLDFEKIEEDSTDTVRWVWYKKFLFSIDELNHYVEITFQRTISDDPYASYTDNQSYYLEAIKIIATDDDLFEGKLTYPNIEVKKELYIRSLKELKTFLRSAKSFGEYF